MTNKTIARLSTSVRTVEGRVYEACMKLGLADRALLLPRRTGPGGG